MLKNLTPYVVLQPLDLTDLDERLADREFARCERHAKFSRGFVPAIPGTTALSYSSQGVVLVRARTESKVLPASVFKSRLQERVDEIEERELRVLSRTEKASLKDAIETELIAQAFTQFQETLILIDTTSGLLYVEGSSKNKAEEATELLRAALGTLPIAPLSTKLSASQVLTGWLTSGSPTGINIGERAVFEDPQTEGGRISMAHQDLLDQRNLAHLKDGLRVERIAIDFQDRLSVTLGSDYVLRSIKLTDVAKESLLEESIESAADAFTSDFILHALEIRTFMERLIELYGGHDRILDQAS